MLSAKNLKQKKLSKKLSNKMIEFFHIQELIDKQTYHFDLSIIYKVHSVFHVFLDQQRDLSVRDADYESSASYAYQKS